MKKKTTPTAIKTALEPSFEAGQGALPPLNAEPASEPLRAFSFSIKQAMIDAKQGDPKAWAMLYAAAASYVGGGVSVPVGLRELITQRLQALSNALYATKDKRASLLDAASPMPTGKMRVYGAKRKSFNVDDAALDVLWYQEYADVSLKAASRKLELLITKSDGVTPMFKASSLEVAARRIKNSKQTPKNST